MNMNYNNKYLKYKDKYLELKKNMNKLRGGTFEFNQFWKEIVGINTTNQTLLESDTGELNVIKNSLNEQLLNDMHKDVTIMQKLGDNQQKLGDNSKTVIEFFSENVNIKKFNIIEKIKESKEKKDEITLFVQQLNCINNKPLQGIATEFNKYFEMKNAKYRGLFIILSELKYYKLNEIKNILFNPTFNIYTYLKDNLEDDDEPKDDDDIPKDDDIKHNELLQSIKNSDNQTSFDKKILDLNLKDLTGFIKYLCDKRVKNATFYNILLLYLFTLFVDIPGDVLVDINLSNPKCKLYNFQSQLFPGITYKIPLTPLRIILLLLNNGIKEKLNLSDETLLKYFNDYQYNIGESFSIVDDGAKKLDKIHNFKEHRNDESKQHNQFLKSFDFKDGLKEILINDSDLLLVKRIENEDLRLNWFRMCILNFLKILIDDTDLVNVSFTLNIPLFISCGLAGGNQSDYSQLLSTLCLLLYLYFGNSIKINLYYYNETEYNDKSISNNMNFFDYLNASKIVRS